MRKYKHSYNDRTIGRQRIAGIIAGLIALMIVSQLIPSAEWRWTARIIGVVLIVLTTWLGV